MKPSHKLILPLTLALIFSNQTISQAETKSISSEQLIDSSDSLEELEIIEGKEEEIAKESLLEIESSYLKLLEDKEPSVKKKYFILSLDGGGIRGIVHARILAFLEALFKKNIAEIFNVVSGTSTGGLVALGVGLRNPDFPDKPYYSAKNIFHLYDDKRDKIFQKGSFWNFFTSLYGVLGPRYVVTGLEGICKEVYGEAHLSDLLIPTFITGLEVNLGKGAYMFSSAKARKKPEKDYQLWEIARATTAAPTYFESMDLPPSTETKDPRNYMNFWDGGLFANNPALITLIEAQQLFNKKDADDFILLSLGTGDKTHKITREMSKSLGLLTGGQQIFESMMAAQNSMTEKYLKKILGDRYVRLKVDLMNQVSMDDTSESYMRYLYNAAEQLISEKKEKIEKLFLSWVEQGGKKLSYYDLEVQAENLISKNYSIPISNRTAIREIYNNYCSLYSLDCKKESGVKDLIHLFQSEPEISISFEEE